MGGRTSPRDSLIALGTAFDAGISFFDTARSYGYGQSEALLGAFLQGRREKAIVCTKFGILPTQQRGWKQRLKPLARGAVRIFPGLRNVIRRQAGDQFVVGQFSIETLHASLETSLRELRTDFVDILLLHAPPLEVLSQEDLLVALGRLVEQGKVRMAGISADANVIEKYFEERPAPLTTAQFAVNASNMEMVELTRKNRELLLVANHPFGGPARAAGGRVALECLRQMNSISAELREKLDPGDPQAWPELLLNSILRGTGISAVIPAMMQVEHIHSNVKAVQTCRFSDGELETLRLALKAGLPAA
jgi:aryl-alcohol dehydrogenase-like predicted oxidoreductase